MDKEFIPYEEALALKELGFDFKCIKGFYDESIIHTVVSTPVDFNNKSSLGQLVSCPLYQQAFRWFREKHGLEIVLRPDSINHESKRLREYVIISYDKSWKLEPIAEPHNWIRKGCFSNHEEAELECLKKLIEVCQTEQKRKLQE